MEDIIESNEEASGEKKTLVLVIYDIVDDKKRNRLAKFLSGYGYRIQKSAFEMMLNKRQYKTLLSQLKKYVSEEDSIRVYKIVGYSERTIYGIKQDYDCEEVIVV